MDMTKFAERLTATVQQKLTEEFFKEAAGLISRVGMETPVTLDLAKGHIDTGVIRFEVDDLLDAMQRAYVKENLESRITSALDAAVESAPSPAPTPVWMILQAGDITIPGDEYFDCNKKAWVPENAICRTNFATAYRRNIAGLQSPTCRWSRLLATGEKTARGDLFYVFASGKWEAASAGMKVQSDSIVARIEE